MRINIKLMRISQFFRQFRFKIKYKFNKKHIIFNVLLRFISAKFLTISSDYFELNVFHINYN